MKISTILTATVLLSAFAVGCAVDSNAAASVADDTQTDEASDALTRASAKGVYVRTAHVAACSISSTVELRADGTFVANTDYSGPTVRCPNAAAPPINGVYSLTSRSNVVTFTPGGRGASTFSLRLSRGRLSNIAGSAANRSIFQGSLKKLVAGECLSDTQCSAGQTCESPVYLMVEGFVPPPVSVGECRVAPPSSPKCGGFAGFICPADMYCDDSARDVRIADQMFDCKPIGWVCTMEYAPVCGTNGITYGNACVAGQTPGVSIAHEGECAPLPPRPRCGGIAGLVCAANSVCRMPVPAHPDAMGICEAFRF